MARTRILVACLALAAPLTVAVPANAAGNNTTLMLSVHSELGTFSVALLKCDPAGGTHDNAAQACDTIGGVNGDVAKLDVEPNALCTMELNPQTATVSGKWRGKKVSHSEEFSNPCLLRAKTGPVFDF